MINRHAVRHDNIIYNGTKVMHIHVAKKFNITFMNSLNCIAMKLSNIPDTFGFEEVQKGYFPHLFNRKEIQSYVGSYPSAQFYGHDYMTAKERVKYLKWHIEKRDETFDFQKEMLAYCRSEVDILRRGCERFHDVMMEGTMLNEGAGINPFDYVTIAGACMGIYKSLFLEEKHEAEVNENKSGTTSSYQTKYLNGERSILFDDDWISVSKLDRKFVIGPTPFAESKIVIFPTERYAKWDSYSKSSIRWLEWVMETSRRKERPLTIRHALTGGEYRIPGTNYRADGFDGTRVYEFHGCVFHGCNKCFPHNRNTNSHPITGQSIEKLYVLTKKRENEIKRLATNIRACRNINFTRI